MAIRKGARFPVPFVEAFPMGLVLVGDIEPDREYVRDPGKVGQQKYDERSGLRQWKANVTDPDEPNGKRASFTVILLADVQPVPTSPEVLPGMRKIELEGVQAEPKRMGQGEYTYLGYVYYASGIAGDDSGSRGSAPAVSAPSAASVAAGAGKPAGRDKGAA
jgi:hypothetical protein